MTTAGTDLSEHSFVQVLSRYLFVKAVMALVAFSRATDFSSSSMSSYFLRSDTCCRMVVGARGATKKAVVHSRSRSNRIVMNLVMLYGFEKETKKYIAQFCDKIVGIIVFGLYRVLDSLRAMSWILLYVVRIERRENTLLLLLLLLLSGNLLKQNQQPKIIIVLRRSISFREFQVRCAAALSEKERKKKRRRMRCQKKNQKRISSLWIDYILYCSSV